MPVHPFVTSRSVGLRRHLLGRAGWSCVLLFAIASCGRSDRDRSRASQTLPLAASPRFVQVSSATPPSPVTTVNLPFTAVQSAGNLNVVVVGWNDTTAEVASLIDTNGNAYQLAVGSTAFPRALSASPPLPPTAPTNLVA